MSGPPKGDEFFIGWSNSIGPGLARFLAITAVLFVGALALAGLGLGLAADDPAGSLLRLGETDTAGGPAPQGDWGAEQTLVGRITVIGSPLLRIPADDSHHRGRVLLLSGDGKRGVPAPASPQPLEVRGTVLRRGTIEMMIVDGAPKLLPESAMPARPAAPEPLGRWRVAGEICDGKCYAGAMRPGAGLAHRACANLCLNGEVPPVFVTAAPVAGKRFLLLADPLGQPLGPRLQDYVAVPVELEGDVERIDNVILMRVDLARAKRL